MEKPLLQLTDPLVWNLALKGEYQANRVGGTTQPIPRQSFSSPTNLLWVGCASDRALPHWWLGCRISMSVPLGTVDSQSLFGGTTEVYRCNVGLFRPQLLHWKAYEPRPYVGTVSFPRWIVQAYVEVYWYDGEDLASYAQKLDEINAKLDGGTGENAGTFF